MEILLVTGLFLWVVYCFARRGMRFRDGDAGNIPPTDSGSSHHHDAGSSGFGDGGDGGGGHGH